MPPRDASGDEGSTVIWLVCGDVVVTRWALPNQKRRDLALIDELAHLQLMGRRLGCHLRLQHVDPQLAELLNLTGLADIVVAERSELAGRPGDPSSVPVAGDLVSPGVTLHADPPDGRARPGPGDDAVEGDSPCDR
jgi:hypothetical protein